MKNFFLIIILSSLTLMGKAQGNLQFNQAKLVNTIDTVPSGKVWKIESFIYSSSIVDVQSLVSINKLTVFPISEILCTEKKAAHV